MPRTKSESIPFNEYLANNSSSMDELVELILSASVEHLKLERVSGDYYSHLNLYLSNFYVAYQYNLNQAVPMGVTYWVNPRVGKNNKISYTTLKNIHSSLCELGYIKQVTNHAHYPDRNITRTFKACPKLVRLFNRFKLNSQELSIDFDTYPMVELRDVKPEVKFDPRRKIAGKKQRKRPKGDLLDLVRFGTKQSERYADQVRAINIMYRSHHINLYVTDAEETSIRKQMSAKDDEEFKTLQFHRWYVRRVFNNKSWEQGGRFYGGWWTSVPSKWRERITIDNFITQEIDFSSIHFNMLYQDMKAPVPKEMCGSRFDSSGLFDPYELQNFNPQWDGVESFKNRKITKLAMNVMLNAESESKALGVIKSDKKKFPKVPTGYSTWQDFTKHILEKHQAIAHKFYSGEGLKYQFRDSEVALNVITRMAGKHNTAVLPIHDSFIVVKHKAEELYQEMKEAMQEVGYSMPMTIDSQQQTEDINNIRWKDCSKYAQRLSNYFEANPFPPSMLKDDWVKSPLIDSTIIDFKRRENSGL